MNKVNGILAVPAVVAITRYAFKTSWPMAVGVGLVIGLPIAILNLKGLPAIPSNSPFAPPVTNQIRAEGIY